MNNKKEIEEALNMFKRDKEYLISKGYVLIAERYQIAIDAIEDKIQKMKG